MSMIRSLGEGYYGVEPTSGRVSQAVLDLIEEAYQEAMAMPENEIVIEEEHSPAPEVSSQNS